MWSGRHPITEFNGLIQHSFALRISEASRPFDDRSIEAGVVERFAVAADDGRRFNVAPLARGGEGGGANPSATHTLLTRAELTTVRPRPVRLLDDETSWRGDRGRPTVLSWAGPGGKDDGEPHRDRRARPRMSFAELEERYARTAENDYMVAVAEPDEDEEKGEWVARLLFEAVAFRRSQLFGLAIANRFVNVMLPYVRLTPARAAGDGPATDQSGPLLLLPLVSLMRDGRDRMAYRRTYSLTLYALPVGPGPELPPRKMGGREIAAVINAGWGLAEAIPQGAVPRYATVGPLDRYVRSLAGQEAPALLDLAERERPLSFRKLTELIAYGVALRMAEGARGGALEETKRHLGDDVITTLSTARVSAALVVDPKLKREDISKDVRRQDPPGSLVPLMEELAGESRPPEWTAATRKWYRLDRPFVDSAEHAFGVLPRNRCLLVAYLTEEERRDRVPLLSLVAGVTFMTVGAATAIGTLRAIDRDLERLEHEDPRNIAEIDDEVAIDLHEIYDLDIANETYRRLYGRLRFRLGITKDYETLQDKMQTLFRAASTFHDAREQTQLAWLTAAIVALSVLILIGTVVAASK